MKIFAYFCVQDTGGTYVDDFPAMLGVSLQSADGVILVYSVAETSSFREVARLRSLVQSYKGAEWGTRGPRFR